VAVTLAKVADGRVDVVVDAGRVTERRVVVELPPGLVTGTVVTVAAQGGASPDQGGPAGDLHVTVTLAVDPLFAWDGSTLTVTVPLTSEEADEGVAVDLPTLTAPTSGPPIQEVRIPRGAAQGDTTSVTVFGVLRLPSATVAARVAVVSANDPLRERYDRMIRDAALLGLWSPAFLRHVEFMERRTRAPTVHDRLVWAKIAVEFQAQVSAAEVGRVVGEVLRRRGDVVLTPSAYSQQPVTAMVVVRRPRDARRLGRGVDEALQALLRRQDHSAYRPRRRRRHFVVTVTVVRFPDKARGQSFAS
jgi:hypothetical protein